MHRGRLRIHLGAAPGAGKTYAMRGSLTPKGTPGGGSSMVLILAGALDEYPEPRVG